MEAQTQAFCAYSLLGANPANWLGMAGTRAGKLSLAPLWALETSLFLFEGSFLSLEKWAIFEALNMGSLQRVPCPVSLSVGSGRWNAGDCGGHYNALRTAIVGWVDLDPTHKRNYIRLVESNFFRLEKPEIETAIGVATNFRVARKAMRGEMLLCHSCMVESSLETIFRAVKYEGLNLSEEYRFFEVVKATRIFVEKCRGDSDVEITMSDLPVSTPHVLLNEKMWDVRQSRMSLAELVLWVQQEVA